MSGRGEILIEMTQLGQTMKVTAVDPATRLEASVICPVHYSRHSMEQAAIRKLDYVIRKQQESQ